MPDPYRVEWTPTPRRDVSRLPEKVATAVVAFVYGALADNPQRVGRALQLDLDGFHAARRGDFRVIYSIDPPEHSVVVRTISHRADVHRSR